MERQSTPAMRLSRPHGCQLRIESERRDVCIEEGNRVKPHVYKYASLVTQPDDAQSQC